jgi:hypothetical protein
MSTGTNHNGPSEPQKLNGLHGAEADEGPEDEATDALPAEELAAPPPPPGVIADLVSSCVRFVHAKYGVLLDGTQDTLSLLDAYVNEARLSAAERPETLPLTAAAIGAYFGEVVRLTFGATWVTVGDHDTWKLCLNHVYLAFNPIGTAMEALTGEDAPGYHAHLQLEPDDQEQLERRLEALGEVPDDEYFLPTTRFDVIHIAVDAIHGRMAASNVADVIFTPDDYEK